MHVERLPHALALAVCLLTFSSASVVHAGDMFLDAKKVTAVGMATVQSGNVAKAREIAIRNAQRNAIEQVVGLVIESRFTAEQKEVTTESSSSFSSDVEEKIYTKSAGYIDSQKVLFEKQDGSTYRVTLEVTVKTQSLAQELEQLDSVLAAAGYPKIVLLVAETYTNKEGIERPVSDPSAASQVENGLLAKHIELMAKDATEKLRRDLEGFTQLVENNAKVAKIAADHGADVAIVGLSKARFSAFNELGNDMYYVSAIVSMRAVRGSTGKVMASVEAEGRGVGVNEDQARKNAVEKAAPKLVKELLRGLVRAWQAEQEQGTRFRVVVKKVRNYRKQGRRLIKLLEAAKGVRQVKESSFGRRTLELEVMYRGDSGGLLDAIFEQTSADRRFRRLDKVGGSGNTIELSL